MEHPEQRGILATLFNIAAQCPYAAGDAVYSARALYAQYVDTLFFDDISLCASPPEDRSLKVTSQQNDSAIIPTSEFVKVYPNPAKDVVNLMYYARITGLVEFEIMNQLGEIVMREQLGSIQNQAQYNTSVLSNGIYYWRLKDSERTIRADKLAIIK